ncbi:hypothetical protein Tsubulata_035923 [Turnera subulata]|uniref:RRM domain-containing protein n=1 Tax=Turnera subulata TaxID=218843 RepID=A0A9Q0G339_9ROSI|nr:hypothetical protein Tsubulata_035923 [Turnera subulata]
MAVGNARRPSPIQDLDDSLLMEILQRLPSLKSAIQCDIPTNHHRSLPAHRPLLSVDALHPRTKSHLPLNQSPMSPNLPPATLKTVHSRPPPQARSRSSPPPIFRQTINHEYPPLNRTPSSLPALLPLPHPSLKLPTPRPNSSTPAPTSNLSKPQHFSKWNRKRIQNIIEYQSDTSLYVNNLPSRWMAVDFHHILSKFGDIIDTYIPAKYAKNGRRFGFVRFIACKDVQRLISFINRLKFDSGFLQASTARGRSPPSTSKTLKPLSQPSPPLPSNHTPYADIIKSSPPFPNTTNPPVDKGSISFSPLPTETEWLSRSAFGILSEPFDSIYISKIFRDHGHLDVFFSELGGDSILVQFPSITAVENFIAANHSWVSSVFDLLRP